MATLRRYKNGGVVPLEEQAEPTIETFVPTSWLRSVDFPTLGRPTSVTNPERKASAGEVTWRWTRPAPTPWA